MNMRKERRLSVFLSTILLLSIFSGMKMMEVQGMNGSFGGGTGTYGNPYLVEDVWDLQNITSNLSAHYILKNDINASASRNWNSGAGFNPIGSTTNSFNGTFDGKNYTISGLFINRSSNDYVGLLGNVGQGGVLKNIRLINVNITGRDNVGGLVGNILNGSIFKCNLTGKVRGNDSISGLIGSSNNCMISNCSSMVTLRGKTYVGGVVGDSWYDRIDHCISDGTVDGNISVGGVIGRSMRSIVTNCSAKGNVSGFGDYIGGLIGDCWNGNISRCNASGNVYGIGDYIGGLLGWLYWTNPRGGEISNCSAKCLVNGTGDYIGGFVGRSLQGWINDSYSSGDIKGTGDYVGGFVGDAFSRASRCFSSCAVIGNGNYIGGFAGRKVNPADHCYSIGNVSGDAYVGGFAGQSSSLSCCYAIGNVSGLGDYVGGLIGGGNSLSDCFFKGQVKGGGNYIAGLIGYNDRGEVVDSFSEVKVSGIGNFVGGIAGYNKMGTINGSHSNGIINGSSNFVGGIAGYSYHGSITNCYFSGDVNGNGELVGGIVGTWSISIIPIEPFSNSFYNIDAVSINGENCITIGGIFNSQYNKWTANNFSLNIEDFNSSLTKSGDYYNISNIEGLRNILGFIYDEKLKFRFDTDIDLKNSKGLMLPYFAGDEINGNNHTISNLHLIKNNFSRVGFIGYNFKGSIINLGLNEVNITGRGAVGGLIGNNYRGNVVNCYTDGMIIGYEDGVGGLVGVNYAGSLSNCYSSCNVTGFSSDVGGLIGGHTYGSISKSYATGNVSGIGDFIGGLIGDADGDVNNSYAMGNVRGNNSIGGFIGRNQETVEFCYSIGNITGNTSIGGFIGTNVGTSLNNSWDMGTSGCSYSSGGTGRSTLQMKDRTTFVEDGWDLINTWCIINNETYPLLRWQDGGYPYANSGANQIVNEGSKVTFNGSGSTDDKGIVNYTWEFFDTMNITLFGINPTYKFDHNGSFLVCLTVKNKIGNIDKDTLTVKVRELIPPIAEAGDNQTVQIGNSVTFNGSGSVDNAGIANYTWRFFDNTNITLYGRFPRYRFDHLGIFVIELNVTDASFNWDIDHMTVTVIDLTPPTASAGSNITINDKTIFTFDGSKSTDNVDIANFTWKFFDGKKIILYGMNPKYQFHNPGSFNITLNVTDTSGNWDIDIITITVLDNTDPIAEAGPDQCVDQGTVVEFNGNGSLDNVGIMNYTWTFYDGKEVNLYGIKQKYQFNNAGNFIVSLKVIDRSDNWIIDTMKVTVNDITPPNAVAGFYIVIDEGNYVLFDGTRSSDNLGIVSYSWNFFDGRDIRLFGIIAKYKFDNPRSFIITLNVTDGAGNWDEDIGTILVRDTTLPIAEAGPDQTVDEGKKVFFDGSQSLDNVGIYNFSWNFFDGGEITLYGVKPSYKFSDPGVFEITLKVTDISGNSNSDTMVVTVKDITSPIAEAGPDQTVDEGTMVNFDGSGSIDNVGIEIYTWSFDDNGDVSLSGVRSKYLFKNPGAYVISLNVIDGSGNSQTDTMILTVRDITPPIAEAGSDLIVDEGTLVTFNGNGSLDNVGIVNYTWVFIDAMSVFLFGPDPNYRFENPGTFTVCLNVTDLAGHWSKDTLILRVKDITSPIADAGQNRSIPIGSKIFLNASSSHDNIMIINYKWIFNYSGEVRSIIGEEINFTFNIPGVFIINLTVIDAAGNSDSDYLVLTVIDTGIVKGIVIDDNGKQIEDVNVEFIASNGKIYTTTTYPNGSFSIEIPYGSFTWKISKRGYQTITGSSSVDPMGVVQIDTSDTIIQKETENIMWIIITIVIILIVILISITLFFIMIKNKEKVLSLLRK